jgi:hypothetical protein
MLGAAGRAKAKEVNKGEARVVQTCVADAPPLASRGHQQPDGLQLGTFLI